MSVHSEYSLLDGMCRIPDLIAHAKERGMYALALTDHGNMFGIKEFLDLVDKANTNRAKDEPAFKPIIGMDAYFICPNVVKKHNFWEQEPIGDEERFFNAGGSRLTLLAKNLQGYYSLCKLTSLSYTDGLINNIPRVTSSYLSKYRDGLIVLSGGIEGDLSQLILKGDLAGAKKVANWHKKLFGEDYYIELMRHKTNKPNANFTTYQLQMKVEPELIRIARKLNIKLVATNDVHFVLEEHDETHDHYICLANNTELDSPSRKRHTKQEWLKSPAEMHDTFSDLPEAIENTMEIADKVEFYSIRQEQKWPTVPIPAQLSNTIKTEDEYLEHLVWDGANKRYGDNLTNEQRERIKHELNVIKKKSFATYFLLIWDIVRAAREELGVAVGPGRGGAAGSIVAYCLHITDIDPLHHGLLFERVFLGPHIKIDIDFESERRGKVITWLKEKYGERRVVHIIAFGCMSSKNNLAEMLRLEKMPIETINALKRLIPDQGFPENTKNEKGYYPKFNLTNCYKYIPEFRNIMEGDDVKEKQVLTMAAELEGLKCSTRIHSCGIAVVLQDISDIAPLCVVEDHRGERVLATQYDGHAVENIGLVKMDILGLNVLTTIRKCVSKIKKTSGAEIDIDNIPLDDKLTFKLFAEGNTVGVFQFESTELQMHLHELQPSSFSDLVALNSLYRPGVMHKIPKLINRKQGNEEVSYLLPEMEPFLKDTYGITVYQEQIMQLSQKLAGFTTEQSNILRRAIGMEQKDILERMEYQFYEGGQKNGYSKETLAQIWNERMTDGRLSFNKSHAVCYTWLAYQTAYLKAHYPAEYMSTLISMNCSDTDRVVKLINDCLKNSKTEGS